MNEETCDQCGKTRTDEPDYNLMQPIMGNPLGWYSSEDEGNLCPEHIAALMNEGNRTSEYVGWSK